MDPDALAAMQDVGTESVSAYNAYLEGLSYEPRCEFFVAPLCIAAYEQALELDPEFAEARFKLASIWQSQMAVTVMHADLGLSQSEFMDRFQEQIAYAINYASNDVDLLKYRAELAASQIRLRDQYELLQEYLSQRPNDYQALVDLISLESILDPESALSSLYRFMDLRNSEIDSFRRVLIYAYRLGDYDTVRSAAQRVLTEAPTQPGLLYQAHRALLWAGNIEEAATAARLFQQTSNIGLSADIDPREFEGQRKTVALRQACAEKREDDAAAIYAAGFNDMSVEWHGLMTLGRTEEATTLLEQYNLPETVLQLYSWMGYPQFDPRPFPYLMAALEREGVVLREAVAVPYACTEQLPVDEEPLQ